MRKKKTAILTIVILFAWIGVVSAGEEESSAPTIQINGEQIDGVLQEIRESSVPEDVSPIYLRETATVDVDIPEAEGADVKYIWSKPDGETKEGVLPVRIESDWFGEGSNQLLIQGTKSYQGIFHLDMKGPEVDILFPNGNAIVDQNTVLLALSASDKGSKLSLCSLEVDGTLWQTIPIEMAESDFTETRSLDLSGMPDGYHTVKAVAKDLAGNESTMERSFTLDRDAPILSYNGISDQALIGNEVTISLSAYDSFSENLALSAYLVGQGRNGERRETSFSGSKTADGKQVCAVFVTEEGSYELSFSAVDHSGHKSSQTISFSVDLSAPKIQNLSSLNGRYLSSFRLPWTEDEMIQDVSEVSVQMQLDGVFFEENEEVTAPGLHRLKLIATDAFARITEEEIWFVIQETSSPRETISKELEARENRRGEEIRKKPFKREDARKPKSSGMYYEKVIRRKPCNRVLFFFYDSIINWVRVNFVFIK